MKEKPLGIIYKSTNKINRKCYIGQTIQGLHKRKLEHLRESLKYNNIYFHNALNKYGKENFEWEILEECSSKEELDEMEFHYIKQYHSFKTENGYNLTWGGNDNIGKNNPMYGKKHSEKTIKKMKENHANVKGIYNPCYGRVGEKHPLVKLTEKEVIEIKKRLQKGEGNMEISKIYNVAKTTIGSIKYGKNWKHIVT